MQTCQLHKAIQRGHNLTLRNLPFFVLLAPATPAGRLQGTFWAEERQPAKASPSPASSQATAGAAATPSPSILSPLPFSPPVATLAGLSSSNATATASAVAAVASVAAVAAVAAPEDVDLDFLSLEERFQAKVAGGGGGGAGGGGEGGGKAGGGGGGGGAGSAMKKKTAVTLIDSKRAYNIGILMNGEKAIRD